MGSKYQGGGGGEVLLVPYSFIQSKCSRECCYYGILEPFAGLSIDPNHDFIEPNMLIVAVLKISHLTTSDSNSSE